LTRATGVLAALCLATALGVVALRHAHRLYFLELQGLRAERDRLVTEWSRLSIEEALAAQHGRIESLARRRLGMGIPDASAVRILQVEGGR